MNRSRYSSLPIFALRMRRRHRQMVHHRALKTLFLSRSTQRYATANIFLLKKPKRTRWAINHQRIGRFFGLTMGAPLTTLRRISPRSFAVIRNIELWPHHPVSFWCGYNSFGQKSANPLAPFYVNCVHWSCWILTIDTILPFDVHRRSQPPVQCFQLSADTPTVVIYNGSGSIKRSESELRP